MPSAGPVLSPVHLERLHEHRRREVRRERERQAEVGRELRAVKARPQEPDRHLGALTRDGAHDLALLLGREVGGQFQHVLGETVFVRRRQVTAQRAHRRTIGAGRAAQPQVDAAGEQRRQRAELLRDRQRCVVGQHDPARADPDRRGRRRDLADQHRGGGGRDAFHVVMFGDPVARVAQPLGVLRERDAVVERLGGGAALDDGGEVEDRKTGMHGRGV